MIRICDEEEETPLHLRVNRSRSVPYPNSDTDTKIKPIYNIDEYVLFDYKTSFIFLLSIIEDIGVRHMCSKLNIQFK